MGEFVEAGGPVGEAQPAEVELGGADGVGLVDEVFGRGHGGGGNW